jgi:hypothetical protein
VGNFASAAASSAVHGFIVLPLLLAAAAAADALHIFTHQVSQHQQQTSKKNT